MWWRIVCTSSNRFTNSVNRMAPWIGSKSNQLKIRNRCKALGWGQIVWMPYANWADLWPKQGRRNSKRHTESWTTVWQHRIEASTWTRSDIATIRKPSSSTSTEPRTAILQKIRNEGEVWAEESRTLKIAQSQSSPTCKTLRHYHHAKQSYTAPRNAHKIWCTSTN